MQETMPQEIEVRYILPAIRRELAKILIKENNLSQKEAAKLLGLTEAAVSQYQHSKRATEVVFSEDIINEIRKSAAKVLSGRNSKQRLMGEMYRISSLTKVRKVLCELHRSQSKELSACNVCFDKELLSVKTRS
ncbi:MAG: transcriptional regulator [Nanoarchaeota archaeon]